MAGERSLNVLNILSILCGLWYIAFGWVWTYFANVLIVFPFAIIGFFLWRYGRKAERKVLNRIAGWLLVTGTVTSFGMLLYWLISEKG